MELRTLEYFMAINREGNMPKASKYFSKLKRILIHNILLFILSFVLKCLIKYPVYIFF